MSNNVLDRLMAKVVKDANGCWNCQLSENGRGYPKITVDGRGRYTHRVAYELLVGPIPDGLDLDHKCSNRRCCNPDHLEPVTPRENNYRANDRHPLGHVRRTTHCRNGHEYTERDRYPNGRKQCRICLAERLSKRYADDADYRERRKEAARAYYQARKSAACQAQLENA